MNKEDVIKALHNMDDESEFAFSVRYAYQTVCDGVNFLKSELEKCKKNRRVPIPGWRESMMKDIYRIREDNINDIKKELEFFMQIKKDIEEGTISYDILYLINHLAVPEHWEDFANKRIMEKYCSVGV